MTTLAQVITAVTTAALLSCLGCNRQMGTSDPDAKTGDRDTGARIGNDGGNRPGSDTGPRSASDAGNEPNVDAGSPLDIVDAGRTRMHDAGASMHDAGASMHDAGASMHDAGALMTVDSGPDRMADAGPPIDASGARNCADHPSACGYPDETNTGVPPGVTLRASGGMTITTDGTVIDGLDITGSVEVQANNVTIRNTQITSGGEAWGVVVIRPGFRNTLIVDSTIRGRDTSTDGIQSAVGDFGGNSTTIRRVHFYNCSQCVSSSNALVEDSYFHAQAFWHIPPSDTTHNEAFYNGCAEGGLTVRHCTIFNEISQTSTVYSSGDFGECHDITVENNLLAGGGYTLYGGMHGTTDHSTYNIRFVNNRFSRKFYPNGGYYGTLAYFDSSGSGNVWSGNFWDDTGASL